MTAMSPLHRRSLTWTTPAAGLPGRRRAAGCARTAAGPDRLPMADRPVGASAMPMLRDWRAAPASPPPATAPTLETP